MRIEAATPQYISSERIKDPRYGKSRYEAVTTSFSMEYQWGELNEQLLNLLAPEHVVLVKLLLDYKLKCLAK